MPAARTGNGRVLPGPFFLERVELRSGLIGGDGPVNRAQIDSHGLTVLPGAEIQGMAHQMHDAG